MVQNPFNLKEISMLQKGSLIRLIEEAGNPSHLARMLGIPVSTVHGWSQRGRISKEGARLVELCPNLSFIAKDLRPDL